jgi:uncharacterized repeat protein (TIGR03803 family)
LSGAVKALLAALIALGFAGLAGCGGSSQGNDVAGPPPPPPPPPVPVFSQVHAFSGVDGMNPWGLLRDDMGNLFGTTFAGGNLACADSIFGCGLVFKIDADGEFTVLYEFTGSPENGAGPQTGLVLDSDGNLYGATYAGGSHQAGTLFRIDSAGNEEILYHFTGGADGGAPELGFRDEVGQLYGVAAGTFKFERCAKDCGTVFRWAPGGTLTVLHAFGGADGATPLSLLVRDEVDTLYGTTAHGGSHPACAHPLGCGTVFSIDASGSFTTLHEFAGSIENGEVPTGRLLLEPDGSLIGTTLGGGSQLGGVVFKREPAGDLSEVHAFTAGPGAENIDHPGGMRPEAGVVRSPTGDLYGVTSLAGVNGWGVLFELDGDSFEKRILHTFSSEEGGGPVGPLVVDEEGDIYGTGFVGGDASCENGCGIVFKVSH